MYPCKAPPDPSYPLFLYASPRTTTFLPLQDSHLPLRVLRHWSLPCLHCTSFPSRRRSYPESPVKAPDQLVDRCLVDSSPGERVPLPMDPTPWPRRSLRNLTGRKCKLSSVWCRTRKRELLRLQVCRGQWRLRLCSKNDFGLYLPA